MYRKSAYDPKEIALIGRVMSDPTILVVRGDSQFNSLSELVKAAAEKPATIAAGHNGVGTNGHLAIVRLERATGAKFNQIPYNGTSQQKVALAGGHLDVEVVAASEIPDPKQEAVPIRMLAQFSSKRVETVGEVATTYELGIPVEMTAERGFASPAGVPQEIKKRLTEAMKAAMSDPAYLKAAVNDRPYLAFLTGLEWERSLSEKSKMFEDIAKSLPRE
jgi:tripartite-type tricarboxylate transporter receptor subunit TctC